MYVVLMARRPAGATVGDAGLCCVVTVVHGVRVTKDPTG